MGFNAEIPSEVENDTAYQIVTACYGVTIFLSLVGNALLFIVFYRNKSFRDLSTVLIVQMSVSNMLYTCLELVFVVVKALRVYLTIWGCKIFVYVHSASRASSSLFLLVVCFERCTAICSPTLCYSLRKIPAVKTKIFAAVWSVAIILRVGVLFLACDPDKVSPGYRIAVVTTIYILPLFLELSTYIAASRKINHGLYSPERSTDLLLFLKKSMNVFALIVITFNICGLPTSIVTIMEAFSYNDFVTPLLRYVLDMIENIPCATTVICYSVCSPKFRQEVINLFRPRRPEEPEEDPPLRWFAPGPESELKSGNQNRALKDATRRLDWIFGDDPSEIIVAATCPDTPISQLKDLPLAMTLTMEDRFQPIQEASSSENSQGGEELVDSRPVCYASTWPRRGNPPTDRERKHFDRGRVVSDNTGRSQKVHEGSTHGQDREKAADSGGTVRLGDWHRT